MNLRSTLEFQINKHPEILRAVFLGKSASQFVLLDGKDAGVSSVFVEFVKGIRVELAKK